MRFIFWSANSRKRIFCRNGTQGARRKRRSINFKKALYVLMLLILTGNFAASMYFWRHEISSGMAWGLKQAYLYAFTSENERIIQFVKDNYLYFSQVENFEEKSESFRKLKNITAEDVKNYILSIKIPDDIYTFVKIEAQYQGYLENEKTPQAAMEEVEKGTYHISIKSFTKNSHKEFERFIKSIPDPQKSTLIIDLRNNGGGSTASVNKMADLLLPYCVTNYEIDRRGIVYKYFSGNSAVYFKEVFVFVNSNSASASEVLALALKSFGNNVKVVGTNTKGKGVGQTTLESRRKQYIIYLVQHYWNSRENNIMKKGIVPDVHVATDSDRDYFQAVFNRK